MIRVLIEIDNRLYERSIVLRPYKVVLRKGFFRELLGLEE